MYYLCTPLSGEIFDRGAKKETIFEGLGGQKQTESTDPSIDLRD